MELLTDVVPENDLSSYELDRKKPMPTLVHGAIQFNIGFELKVPATPINFVLPARLH